MQTESQSKTPEMLTNHTIPDYDLIIISLAKNLQKLQFLIWLVILSMIWEHGTSTSTCSLMLCPAPANPNYSELPKPARLSLGTHWIAFSLMYAHPMLISTLKLCSEVPFSDNFTH